MLVQHLFCNFTGKRRLRGRAIAAFLNVLHNPQGATNDPPPERPRRAYAHYQDDGAGGLELVLGWINEMVDQEACEAASSSQ